MKVMLIDDHSPRSDGRSGKPTGVTLGKVYTVAEVLTHSDQYSIINDDFKMARYSQSRFEVVDISPVQPLRQSFNELTTGLRTKSKLLEKEVARLNEVVDQLRSMGDDRPDDELIEMVNLIKNKRHR